VTYPAHLFFRCGRPPTLHPQGKPGRSFRFRFSRFTFCPGDGLKKFGKGVRILVLLQDESVFFFLVLAGVSHHGFSPFLKINLSQ